MGFSSTQLGHEDEVAVPVESPVVPVPPPKRPTDARIAVQVKDACKAYGRNSPMVLNHLDMTVTRGTIYGLLGASGCGKTTMLSCIVGLRKLDHGEVWVYGAKPGTKESGIPGKTIGYMPQDIALYQKFSIQEILHYFGGIYGMSKVDIENRMEFLMGFLDLPETTRRICTLSGGQQRRVSLAVSMIHTPALLILDEPTVGVDPLIRENIWEYLIELVSRKRTTVIITTHYIEEARQSDTVGLMRNGRLLTEKPPQDLLEEHQANLLEDIVLKLCRNDTSLAPPQDEVSEIIEEMSFYNKKRKSDAENGESNGHQGEAENSVVGLKFQARSDGDDDDETLAYQRSMAASIRRRQSVIETVNNSFARQSDKVLSLVRRNFLTLFRNPMFVLALLVLPTFQTVLFNFIVGRDPINKLVGVVNGDFSDGRFKDFCAQRNKSCFGDGLSCGYLNKFGNNIVWDEYNNVEDALDVVRAGDSQGVMIIPRNFTEHMKNRGLHRNYIDNETIEGSTIQFHMDFSNQLVNVFLLQNIYDNYLSFAKDMVENCGGNPRTVEVPLKYNAIYGSLHQGTAEYMQPPQILMIMFLLPMTVAVTYIWDKKAGTLDRTMCAGVEFFHVILSLLITEGVMMILELTICLFVLIVIFNLEIVGSVFLVFLLGLLSGICGLSFGFLFGTLCDHEIEVLVLTLFVYLPTLISSGGTWPREGIQTWAKILTAALPITLPAESIRSVVSRGWGITHPNVWPGFVAFLLWITLCCFLSGFVHKKRR